MRRVVLFLAVSTILPAASPAGERAQELFEHTEYQQSLALLLGQSQKDAATLQLIGQNYFMLGEYKKSIDPLERAVALEPANPRLLYWLGRAYCRRAETVNMLAAPGYAGKARQNLEKSVRLDPSNKDATGDLLDFYLGAPGFMGGGVEKAETLARLIGTVDPAEQHYAQAVIDEHRKDYDGAERELRQSMELDPRRASRFVALAKYLARRGRVQESDALFDQAARMAPGDPRILFDRAEAYAATRRNLGEARELLQKYLRAPLTPDDPPRERAEALLRKIN